MSDDAATPAPTALNLEVRRLIRAKPERLFAAWTEPAQLKAWFGPRTVTCVEAQVDLRVGGRYRLGNRFADGRLVWISGAFVEIAPPRLIVYTWELEPGPSCIEKVTVRFEPRGGATEVVVLHERIPDMATRDRHGDGWDGCLDGLAAFVAGG